MLVELRLVEQRYKAVLDVLDGAVSVTDVAPLWRRAADGALLAAAVRGRGTTGADRSQLPSELLPAPDAAGR